MNDGGVIAYTKNLAKGLSQWSDVTVFCEKNDNSPTSYSDSQVKVIRCWRKGPSYPFYIWFKCFRSKFDIFHVQHEYFLYGGFLSAIIFPLLLLFLNIYAPVIVTVHGVISKQNVNKLSDSNRPLNQIKLSILKANLRLIDLFSIKLIVHDKFIKDVLIEEYTLKSDKIDVIPHGIEEVNPIDEDY